MKRNFLALIEAASFVFLKQRYSVEQEGMLMKWRIVLLLKKRKTLFWKVDCKKKSRLLGILIYLISLF
jgi:hypothetical protein